MGTSSQDANENGQTVTEEPSAKKLGEALATIERIGKRLAETPGQTPNGFALMVSLGVLKEEIVKLLAESRAVLERAIEAVNGPVVRV